MSASSTIGQRFSHFISHLGISKNAFAASLDKTATVIQHIVDERNKPGYDLLCKVFEIYPNVSKDWLLQGQGRMLKTAESVLPTPVAAAGLLQAAVPSSTDSSTAAFPQAVTMLPPAPAPAPLAEAPIAEAPAISVSGPAPVLPGGQVAVAASADATMQAALYAQQLSHQLALAELRNQHLQDQQRLMQKMVDMLQRQLPR